MLMSSGEERKDSTLSASLDEITEAEQQAKEDRGELGYPNREPEGFLYCFRIGPYTSGNKKYKAAAEGEISYKQNRPIDGKVEYWNGKIIMHHEATLEDGLLGYTDTESLVYVTTENRYGHSKQKILDHEHLHILHPEWGEYEIRTATDHNASVDIGLELRSLDKEETEYEKAYA